MEYMEQGLSRIAIVVAIAFVTLFAGDLAVAHTEADVVGGFASGFSHPFHGIDHLLAMVSVGLWSALLGRPFAYALPVVFPAVMVVGAALSMSGMPLPPVEIGIALSVLVLGVCVAISFKTPMLAAATIVATFAVFHGHAHGQELPLAADPIGYSAGFVLATVLLHSLGIGIGFQSNRRGGVLASRSVGGAIGLAGAWFLSKAAGL